MNGKNRGSKVKDNGSNRSQVERLVDIMFSDVAVPIESMAKMRSWIADPDKADEKSDALYGKFLEIFKFNPEPVLAPQLWPELARRLGMNETPVRVTSDPLAPRQSAAVVREPETEPEPEPEPALVSESEPESVPARRKLTFGRMAARVAAVLVPVAVALGTVLWFTLRGPKSSIVEITVPAGGTQTIILPDGSRVEASSGATVSYDEIAFADHRVVKLSGEALFDVAEVMYAGGATAPFTVEADNLTVNVLGTVFRLARGDGGSEAAAVSLYEGRVGIVVEPQTDVDGVTEIETVLAAGERLRVNTLTGEHITELIPASEMAEAGFMPLLRFDEATLGDVIVALEMNYDVEFDVAEGIDCAGGRYTADFEELSLGEVLGMLSKIDVNLTFEQSAEKVNVRRKK